MKVIKVKCIKRVPHLAEIGDEGTIERDKYTIVTKGLSSGFDYEPWYNAVSFSTIRFKFSTIFYEGQFKLVTGNTCNLNEYFEKI